MLSMVKLFSDIYGQESAIKILSAQLKSNQLAHSYLFLGSTGLGKQYFARKFAKYILCENITDDQCPSCSLFYKNSHPDFIFLDGNNKIKIDDLRQVIERLNYSPSLSKRKVALFTNCDNLSREVANAMLKTLEEPPLDSVIILTAISTRSLPETIVSRTQRIRLLPIGTEKIKRILLKNYDNQEVESVLSIAEDNLGEAKKALDDLAYRRRKQNIYNDAKELLSGNSLANSFLILEKNEKEDSLAELFNMILKLIVDSLFNGKNKNDNFMEVFSEKFSLMARIAMFEKMLKIYQKMQYNISLRLHLEEFVLENLING